MLIRAPLLQIARVVFSAVAASCLRRSSSWRSPSFLVWRHGSCCSELFDPRLRAVSLHPSITDKLSKLFRAEWVKRRLLDEEKKRAKYTSNRNCGGITRALNAYVWPLQEKSLSECNFLLWLIYSITLFELFCNNEPLIYIHFVKIRIFECEKPISPKQNRFSYSSKSVFSIPSSVWGSFFNCKKILI